jgi:hypothetical protein
MKMYILNDEMEPVPVSFEELAAWDSDPTTSRQVALAQGTTPNGRDMVVSTVFLGIDHSFGGSTPILFETMVFIGDSAEDIEVERCSTFAESLLMHQRMVDKMLASHGIKLIENSVDIACRYVTIVM